jgi:predicted PurR-regulated permease PerM
MPAPINPDGKTPAGPEAPISRGEPRGALRSSVNTGARSLDPDIVKFRPMTVVATGTIIALLFFARDVFIPLSLAVLLSFLLAIPCSFLERHGFKRAPAVVVVVALTFSVLFGAGWLLSAQFYNLAGKLPGYHEIIDAKLKSLKASPRGTVGKFNQMLRRTAEELKAPDLIEPAQGRIETSPSPTVTNTTPAPIAVEVREPRIGPWGFLGGMVAPVMKPLATAFIVLVVLFFMLLGREDLRNRLIRLAGTDRMDLTTDALDEAADRVSRYLLMQLIVNCCFGLLIGAGLFIIGVPSPALWGVLAMLLRFVPYVGSWIAAIAPLALAFAMDPGWAKLAWTAGLYATVELMTANIIEPLLYGSSTGVSPLALLLAAIFWTWLWGPMGLLLSTPLTVCLAVMGLHIPQLRFLHVLLGDEPVLTPETRFYQRMLAMDREEAEGIVEHLLKEKPLATVYGDLMIPALTYAKEDLSRGRLTKEKENFVLENIAELVEELAEDDKELAAKSDKKPDNPAPTTDLMEAFVAVMPAKDKVDEIAGVMLGQILAQRSVRVISLPAAALTSDRLDDLTGGAVKVVCISVVPPTNLRRARYLCKKLRSRFPAMKLVIGFWGGPQNVVLARESLAECKPDGIACNFEEAAAAIISLGSITSQPAPSRAIEPEIAGDFRDPKFEATSS